MPNDHIEFKVTLLSYFKQTLTDLSTLLLYICDIHKTYTSTFACGAQAVCLKVLQLLKQVTECVCVCVCVSPLKRTRSSNSCL